MFRKTLPVIAAAAAFALFLSVTQGQDQEKQGKDKAAAKGSGKKKGAAPAPGLEIQSVKTNLYVITGAGGNTAVRVTNAGVIVVDTKNPGENNYTELMRLSRKSHLSQSNSWWSRIITRITVATRRTSWMRARP
jgi:hypothetical protein